MIISVSTYTPVVGFLPGSPMLSASWSRDLAALDGFMIAVRVVVEIDVFVVARDVILQHRLGRVPMQLPRAVSMMQQEPEFEARIGDSELDSVIGCHDPRLRGIPVSAEFRCQSIFSRGIPVSRGEFRCQGNSGDSGVSRNSGVRAGIPVSGRLFAWRTTTTARLMVDAEAIERR